ncbi:TPA: hypothetical protein I7730_01765 [Vibrio vulnificus]|uniref:Uncharacterized protein n=1 Tax=Vibrio vulnificus TaxID=672 RepID=A0A8H9K5V2_VIBVL|nr:hypothetical protein [Vibrio vulnificus]HAS8538511.1 hypothetical protein [Vibrio vulnificus]
MMNRKLKVILISLAFSASTLADENWFFDLSFDKLIDEQNVQKRIVSNGDIQSDGSYVWQFIPDSKLDVDFDYFATYVAPLTGSIISVEAIKNYDSYDKCALAMSYVETTKLDGYFEHFSKVENLKNKELAETKNSQDIAMYLNNSDDYVLQIGCIKSTIFPDKHALILSVSSEALQEKLKKEYTQYLVKN